MRLSWDRLLCRKRPHKDGDDTIADGKPKTLARTAFGQDYSRVVFSTAFKRLSKKMQVHPFANNATDYLSLSSGDAKLAELTWGRKYAEEAIKDHRGDIMWWLHAVTDHIVGMTDDYAQKMASLF